MIIQGLSKFARRSALSQPLLLCASISLSLTVAASSYDPNDADATGTLPGSGWLANTQTHALLDLSTWPRAVIDLSVHTKTNCYNQTAHSDIQVDVLLGTLQEIRHKHYARTDYSTDGYYGDGTDTITTRLSSYARHSFYVDNNNTLIYYSWGSACGGSSAVTSGEYWVFDNINHAPNVATPIAAQDATENQAFSMAIGIDTFADPDPGDSLTLAVTPPAWLSYSNGTLSGTPSDAEVGTHTVSLRATDQSGAFGDHSFVINVQDVNNAPQVEQGLADQLSDEDQSYSFSIPSDAFSDADSADTLSYSLVSAPSWLSLSGLQLSGTPTQSDVGTQTVTLRASDPGGLSADTDFALTVNEVNDESPRFLSSALHSSREGQLDTSYFASTADVDSADVVSYSISGGDDAALFSIDPNNGRLSFAQLLSKQSPQDADGDNVYQLTLRAEDAAGNAATQPLSVQVVGADETPLLTLPGFKVEAFHHSQATTLADTDWDSTPDSTHYAQTIDYSANWPASTPAENYAYRISGILNAEVAGSYSFRVRADEGSALYIDGQQLYQSDSSDAANSLINAQQLSAGVHTLELRYFQHSGDRALKLEVMAPGESDYSLVQGQHQRAAFASWWGDVLNQTEAKGVTEIDWKAAADAQLRSSVLDYPSNNTSLAPGANTNLFGAEFVGDLLIREAGDYVFSVTADDGFSLTIDGAALIANSTAQPMTTESATATLSSGIHRVAIRLADKGGNWGLKTLYRGPDTQGNDVPPLVFTADARPQLISSSGDQTAVEDQPYSQLLSSDNYADDDHARSQLSVRAEINGPSIYDPPDDERRFQSYYLNRDPGRSNYSSRLESDSAWIAGSTTDASYWMELPLPKDRPVVGLITRGRHGASQWVKEFKLSVFDSQNNETFLNNGAPYPGNVDRSSKLLTPITVPSDATRLRITATDWQGHATIRAALATEVPDVNVYNYDPPDQLRSFSAIYNNDDVGSGHATSQLDSAAAWVPGSATVGHWMEIPIPSGASIAGVTTQGRSNGEQYVTEFRFSTFDAAGQETLVQAGAHFPGNSDRHTKVLHRFEVPTDAVRVRIYPMAWQSHPSMRAALAPSWLLIDGDRLSGTPLNGDSAVNVASYAVDPDGKRLEGSDRFDIAVSPVNDAPYLANPVPDQQSTEDTPFSYSAPVDTFADVDDATPPPVLSIGDPNLYNPPDSQRQFSSIYSGSAPGADYGQSTLDSERSWTPSSKSDQEWIQLPLPSGMPVVGVITQGRTDQSQWITQFTASSIDAQGNESPLNGGAILNANSDRDTKVLNRLDIPDSAVAIRLYPYNWKTYPSMRVALAASWLLPDGDTISGIPLDGDGPITVTATGTDDDGLSSSDTFVVNITAVNDAPVVSAAIPDQSATEDSAFTYSVPAGTFSDIDGDTLSISLSSTLPTWLSFDATTARFSGTPLNADVGSVSITVQASDASTSVTDTFVLSVANTNDAPVVNAAIPDQSVNEDSAFAYSVPADTFVDVDGDTLSLTVTSTLPSWLSFDATTARFSGTPLNADVGSVSITVQASDASTSVTDTFVLSVANTNDAPVLNATIPDQSATEDSAFAYSVPANTFGDVDGDTLSLAVTSTLPSWLSFDATTARFSGTPLNADVGSVSITVQASDASSSVADTFVLSVANTNDAPTLANPVANASATEDAAFSLLLPANTFSDVDSGDTLTLSAPTLPVWLSFDPANRSLSGTPNNNHVGENPVLLRATDAAGASAEAAFAVQVSNVNDAPTLDQGIDDQAATEDLAFSLTIPSDAFSDPDPGETLSYAILSGPPWLTLSAEVLSGTPDQADVGTTTVTLRATDSGALSTDAVFALSVAEVNDNAPVFSSATAVSVEENRRENIYTAAASDADTADSLAFSIAGDDAALFSLDATSGALDFVSAPDFENPDDADADRRYQLQIRATDAADNSAVLALTVTVLDVNDNAPSFSSATTHSAPEGDSASGYIAAASDPDSADTLSFAVSGGDDAAHFDIDPSTGVLSFAHPLDFESPQDRDADNTYTIELRARDAAGNSATLALAIDITDTNDNAPSFSSAATASVDENATDTAYTATASDPDLGDTLAFAIEPGLDGALFNIDPSTGALAFIAAPDFESPADADANNIYLLTLSATDSSGASGSHTLAVSVDDLNDTAPSFLSSATVAISEDNYSVGYTALATDPDTDDAHPLSLDYALIGGPDAALFSLVQSTGVLSFITAPDYEAPDDAGADRVYNLRLRASDTAANTRDFDLAITLLDANDNAPKFDSSPFAVIPEGTNGVFYTASAVDPDTNDAVRFAIASGNEAGLFSIDPNAGALSVSAVDFEAPAAGSANNVYALVLRASDAADNTKDYTLAITVDDVNDNPPTITSADTTGVDENTTATGYTATATDPDTDDALTWALGGGADDALFSIDPSSGALRFNSAPDAEAPADADADNTYNVLIRALDAGANSADLALALRVDNLNDNAPVFRSTATVDLDENRSDSPWSAAADDADATGISAITDPTRYTISGGPDAALFSIDPVTGVLNLDHPFDAEAPEDDGADNTYQLQISASDRADNTTVQALAITVLDTNDNAPALTSPERASVDEGNTAIGYTATSTDPDRNDSVTYSLEGSDAAAFSIDANGLIRFAGAPDFEAPQDADADNTYAIRLIASDAAANTDSLDIAVTVNDRNDETPVIASAASASVAEGSTAPFYAASASDADAGDTLAFSLAGEDAALFTIDALSGALRLRAPADFETPVDANADNLFALTLRATDAAGNRAQLPLSVTLGNVNEAPSASAQAFEVGEFANIGAVIGSLQGSDPDGDGLNWSLLDPNSPFALSHLGVLSLATPLDFEANPSYRLNARLSDGALSAEVELRIAVRDENEILQLVVQLPLTAAQLRDVGVRDALDARQRFYNDAIAAANPPPTTLAQLQTLIDAANATAELSTGSATTGATSNPTAVIDKLDTAGVDALLSENASAYERAIAAAPTPPTTAAELQAIVDEVNTVQALATAVATLNQTGSNTNANTGTDAAATLAQLLANIDAAPQVPQNLLPQLAALIDRSDPAPTTEAEIVALANALLERASDHPVLWLSLEQGNQQVQQVRLDGGTVTVTAHIDNPVPGLPIQYDWARSHERLRMFASSPNTTDAQFLFEPAQLVIGESQYARVTVLRNGLRSNGELRIRAADTDVTAAQTRDSDGDGVLDAFEGELEASADTDAANKLQTVRGDDLSFVMESSLGSMLRLGSVARESLSNQAQISLDELITHLPGATADTVIEQLPSRAPADSTVVLDFEVATLEHVGASVAIVVPLNHALLDGARYVKYHPATGWRAFVEDGLNRLRSAPALAGILGQCPPPGHNAYSDGLSEGHACIEITLEDGGPNDADRLDSDGQIAQDFGLNGTIKDPGALVYTDSQGLLSTHEELSTGVAGGGATGFSIALIALVMRRRKRR